MDEFELIEALRQRFARGARGRAPALDIGDDAAVLVADARPLVLSVDASVEGVHFERRFATATELGYRAMMAAASDLAAMGAEPECALLALLAPRATAPEWLLALGDGLAEAASECGLRVVGGNLSRGDVVSMTTTVLGRIPADGAALSRAGARAGDDLYVSGPLGGAALGLACLQSPCGDERVPESETLRLALDRWRRPRARVALGQTLRGVASSAIDLSDGLLQDVSHLARASSVRLRVELAALPLLNAPEAFRDACRALSLGPEDVALTGGEDYELAFTAAPERRAFISAHCPGVTRIGGVVLGEGVEVLGADGQPWDQAGPAGFRHFG